MAALKDAQQAIVDLIVEAASTQPETGRAGDRVGLHKAQAEAIVKLAEAHAWLVTASQPHG